MHKLTPHLLAVSVSVLLAACGGGGSTSAPATSALPATPSEVQKPIDPYTNQPATGTTTSGISGVVFNAPTTGATVTAYAVLPDGSNGASLGISAATGTDGTFSIQLTGIPAGMVRLVATSGTYTSEADNTTQANTSLELVTPYVTSDLNYFVITPITHIVSHLVSTKARYGATLTSAYKASVGTALSLSVPNVILKDDVNGGIDLLRTLPGSGNDTLNTYQDVLTAFEWYGVRYDLPSSVVTRILAANAENDFPIAGVDGANTPINVGKWSGSAFDQTIPFTFDELTAQKNPDGSNLVMNGNYRA